MKPVPVIVLDGNQRSSLAVVRSLGRRGIPVIVGETVRNSISAVSRFCTASFIYPDPYENSEDFLGDLVKQCQRYPGALLIPMTDVSLNEVLKNREMFEKEVIIPFPSWNMYQSISDKINLFRQAMKLHLSIPHTFISTDFNSVSGLISETSQLGFPLVLKPSLSRFKKDGKWLNATVKYVQTKEELKSLLNQEPFCSFPFLVQEKVEGFGVGVFLFIAGNQVLARFAHQRLREKPPSGGVSVLCQGIDLPMGAYDSSIRLLQSYNWSGVAMAEFKMNPKKGEFKLMEVNARFWGSLQLAVSAGVDFPYLLYSHALGENLAPQNHYRIGLKSRWELGDLDHLFLRFRRSNGELNLPPETATRARLLKDYLCDFFQPSVRHEVFRYEDPKPFFSELGQYIQNLVRLD